MTCTCGNAARYMTIDGRLTCALCPLAEGVDSIRLADVPALLRWARLHLNGPTSQASRAMLAAILGKDVSR